MNTVFTVLYRPIGDPKLLDPNLHVIRELLIVEEDAILVINDPATLVITSGNVGSYAKVYTASTMEFG